MLEYTIPEIPVLFTFASFLFFINLAEGFANGLIEAGLLGSLVVGIIYGPEAANILPTDAQTTFQVMGYIGLLLLVFEAGLSTDMSLLYKNIWLSLLVALTGVALPIGLSILLLSVGYKYTVLQGFAAGAALCSTSLGTTLALLSPEIKKTRAGVVLLSAALIDDVVGLVIAAIISGISSVDEASVSIKWQTVVRPIMVSVAFGLSTFIVSRLLRFLVFRLPTAWKDRLRTQRVQLFMLVFVLAGYVAGANYSGTSELFGAYLAGTLLSHVFALSSHEECEDKIEDHQITAPIHAFTIYIIPILQMLLSPLFFASIGAALPIRTLGSVHGSHRVVWRGIIYSLLMGVAKAVVGVWMLVWPERDGGPHILTIIQSATLLGIAMVARGEIALIVAEIARPILGDDEPFAVVVWAILLNTVGGAVGVGLVLRARMDKHLGVDRPGRVENRSPQSDHRFIDDTSHVFPAVSP
ncbi:sodium-hydrogen antiporter [Armillaria novae-zelandiae]|uniref:Sodium-hydrogen antiporter n=1 Tax=Armillaria novae-zelandiae TaxID=153914 RepID=A0AA39PIJ4_9AGAR|nr:sodium-hydrogen antiporter [Armillaria novae-zelandiae]